MLETFFTEIALENRAFGPVSRPEKPAFHRRNRAFGPISRPKKPGFHRQNRAETGPKIDPQNHCVSLPPVDVHATSD